LKLSIFRFEGSLDLDGALDHIHDTGEFGEYAVAGRIDEAPVVLFDQTVDDLAMRDERAMSRLFVLAHEAAIAVNVGAQDGGEFPFHARLI
jgi:hypothetical protein